MLLSRFKIALWALMAVLLSGCATVLIDSNTDYKVLPRFSRVLVVSTIDRDDREYLLDFARTFPLEYDVCTVSASKLAFGNPDSLIQQKARECRSEVVLTVSFTRNYMTGGGRYSSSIDELYAEMSTFPDRKPFWKGVVRTDGYVLVSPRQIVKKLYDDRIIDGRIPSGAATTMR